MVRATVQLYGTARTSPRSYFPHHTAAISAAIALADATSVMQAAAALSELPALAGSRAINNKISRLSP